MKIEKFGITLILPALAFFGTSVHVNAQTSAQMPTTSQPSSQSVIPLEVNSDSRVVTPQSPRPVAALPNPFVPGLAPSAAPRRAPVLASPQQRIAPGRPVTPVPSEQTAQDGRRGVARLRNPYEWSGGANSVAEPTSLLGLLRQRRAENEIIIPPPSKSTGPSPSQGSFEPGYPGSMPTQDSTLPSAPGGANPLGGTTPATPSPNMAVTPAQPSAPSTAPGDSAPTPPSVPQPETTAGTPSAAPTATTTAAASAAAAAATADTGPTGPGFGGGLGASQGAVAMIGDMSPYRLNPFGALSARSLDTVNSPTAPPGAPSAQPPSPPSARSSQIFYPSVRIFKIAENMSPRPQDRFFFNMNNYWQVNQDINRKFEVPVKNINAYRYFFGFEKTFNDGNGSIGLRFPITYVQ